MAMESVKARKAHVAIHVKDVGASIEFYGKLFGIEPCKVRTGYAKFDVANPPLNFTLNETTEAGQGALSHLGIQVESTADVLAVRQQLAGTRTAASRRNENGMLLRAAGQGVGPRSRRERMGSLRRPRGQPSGKAGRGKIVLRSRLLRACCSLNAGAFPRKESRWRNATTSSFCAREIPRVRSWPRRFSTGRAGPTSSHIARAAIRPGMVRPEALRAN